MTTVGGAPPGADVTGDDAPVAVGWAVALLASAWIGAVAAWPVPPAPAAVIGLVCWWLRRPLLVVAAVGLLASGLGARAVDGLGPAAPGPFAGVVELVTDPRPSGPVGMRAEVRLPTGQRVRATAHGPPGWALERADAGSRVVLVGRVGRLDRTAWSDSRHLVGTLVVERVDAVGPGGPLSRLAGVVREAVSGGARRLPAELRPLYLGLVIGDDREQPPAQQAAFRVAGMTHLLAVSGQNVAFVLLAAGPVLRRLTTWPRLVAVVGVLVVFATVTRFEPSVLRATATAGLAAWSVALGRPTRGLRALCLAVAGLVLVDPLLVRSVGFQLSVAASAGIVGLGPGLQGVVPGPRWLREPLVVTASAQLAVLPVLTSVFGPVSVASVPANLLVSWTAGLVMTWGLTVGPVAGVVPDWLGEVLQAPAAWSLRWIDAVARAAAGSGAPRLGAAAALPLAVAVAWWLWAPAARRLGLLVVALVVALAPTRLVTAPLPGARLCAGGDTGMSVLIVDDAGRGADLLEALLDRGVRQVDLVVAARGGRNNGQLVDELRRLVAVGVVVAPPQHEVVGARRVQAPLTVPIAAGALLVDPVDDDTLQVSGPC